MPELPDVEIFRRLVADHCRGRVVDHAAISDPGILEGTSPRDLERQLKGRRVRSSDRHGKHLFIMLDGDGALTMHFGTNGSLRLVSSTGAEPPSTRLSLHFAEGDRLAYVNPRRLGRVSLCESVAAFVARSGLGPDALDTAFDLEAFAAILGGSKRDLKTVLMDQELIAGIGNIYSDEILFQARIYPGTIAASVARADGSRLYRAMRETLEIAIRCGAGAENAVERLPQDFLLPHRRPGGRCPRCSTPIAAIKRAGRTGYYCPSCQRPN